MNRTDPKAQRTRALRKALSHGYALFDAALAFFAVWTFASMMRVAVGLSQSVYWLAKAWIQQVAIIGVAVLMLVLVIGGQHLFERAMLEKEVWLPKSFLAITALMVLVYGVSKIILWMH
jgi:hypothetical protein